MLWPRLSPERSCVCCRSRRRLGRLRARPASHCNLDRVVFRYQNERRSRLLAASSYCGTGIDLFENPASPVFSPAPGPIRTARNGLSAVGRYSASTPAVSFAQRAELPDGASRAHGEMNRGRKPHRISQRDRRRALRHRSAEWTRRAQRRPAGRTPHRIPRWHSSGRRGRGGRRRPHIVEIVANVFCEQRRAQFPAPLYRMLSALRLRP